MEFVAKKKTIKVTIADVSYDVRCPSVGEHKELQARLKAPGVDPVAVYEEFFAALGLPKEATNSMDHDTFLEFVEFVLAPKKKV